MTAPRRLQLRRGNTTAVSTYVGAPGELIVDTDTSTLYLHNGITVGGVATTINTASITSNISALQGNVTILQSNAAVQAGNIATIFANLGATSGTLANINSNLGAVAGSLTTLTSNAAVQAGAIATLTANAAVQAGNIATLTANAASQAGDIATIYANLGAVSGSIATLTSNAATQAGNIATLTANAASQAGDIATIYANLGAVSGSIATLTSNAATQAGTLATLTANAAVQAGLLDTLTGNAASQGGELASLVANAATQAGALATLTSNAASQSGTLADLVANAAVQAGLIAGSTGTYGNSNVAAYLPTYSGIVGNITVSGTISASGGSATAPAITRTGDTNTGIFFPASDTIAFSEGGAEAMRINQFGEVSIGSTNASGKFSVVDANNSVISAITSAVTGGSAARFAATYTGGGGGVASGLNIEATDGTTFIYTTASVPLRFGTNNAERLNIGLLGQIGLSGPNYGTSGQVLTSNGNAAAPTWQSNYSNTQVATYLPTYSGNIGNIDLVANLGATSGSLATLTANAASQAGSLATLTANAAVQAGSLATITTVLTSSNVAIGENAAYTAQGQYAVAIGLYAGGDTQGERAVAIGSNAGKTAQGAYAVAIGRRAGETDQGNNSIIINATTGVLNQTTANTFTVAPVRNDVANISQIMFYNTTSKEVTYGNIINIAGNVSANYFVGNGALLTGIVASAGSTYANTNVAAYLAANIITTAITTQANISTTGYFVGNGALLTGIVASASTTYSNTNVAAYLSTATINTTGNITAGNLFTGGALYVANITTTGSSGNISGANYITANVILTNGGYGNISNVANLQANTVLVSGNITAQYFLGNGALLTGIAASSNYSNANVATYLTNYDGDINFTSSVAIISNVDVITVMDHIRSPSYQYSNGVSILAGLGYGNTEVATYLPTYSGNVANIRLGTSGVLTFADGTTQITAGGAGGSTYSNANVATYLADSRTTFFGNTSTHPLSSNVTQIFIGNSTSLTSGNGTSPFATALTYNMYFAANNTPLVRNTQLGAGIISLDLNGFTVAGLATSQTANSAPTLTNLLRITSAGAATFVSTATAAGVTTTAALAVNSALGITSNQTSQLIFNQTVTSISMGTGAATTINLGTTNGTAGNVFVGSNLGTNLYNLRLRANGQYNLITSLTSNGGYNIATYSNIAVTGGSGNGMIISMSGVASGYLGSANITNPGTGYVNGDTITIPAGNPVGSLGGSFVLQNYNATKSSTQIGTGIWTFHIEGNLTAPGNITIASNSSYFIGNALGTTATYTGNVSANYFTGNGALLTGIVTGGGTTYSNANVASYLPTYSGNIGNVSTTANVVTTQYFIGNGALLTGIVSGSSYGNTDVATYLGTVGATSEFVIGNNTYEGWPKIILGSAKATIQACNAVILDTVLGNIYVPRGNITTPGIKTDNYYYANGTPVSFGGGSSYGNTEVASYLPTYTGNIGGNIGIPGTLTVYSANSSPFTTNDAVYVVGGVTAANLSSRGVIVACSFATSTNINSGAIQTNGGIGAGGNIYAGQNVVATGNVTANIFVSNTITGVVPNANTTITAGTYTTTFDTNGNVTAQGNVVANYLFGNGAFLTGVVTSGGSSNYANANVAVFLSSFGSNSISTTGNVAAGNVTATGNVTAAYFVTSGGFGNITQVDTITANNVVATANLTVGGYGIVSKASFIGALNNAVTVDNIVAKWSSANPSQFQIYTLSGNAVSHWNTQTSLNGTFAVASSSGTLTTSPTNFGGTAGTSGDMVTVVLTNTTVSRAYRIIGHLGASYANNAVIVERIA